MSLLALTLTPLPYRLYLCPGLVVPVAVVRLSLDAPETGLVVKEEVASTMVQVILSTIAVGFSIVLLIVLGLLLVLFVLLGLLAVLLLWLP